MKEISEQEKKILSLVKQYYKDLKVVECDVAFKVDGAIADISASLFGV